FALRDHACRVRIPPVRHQRALRHAPGKAASARVRGSPGPIPAAARDTRRRSPRRRDPGARGPRYAARPGPGVGGGRVAKRTREPVPGRYPVAGGEVELLRDLDRPDGWMIVVNGVPQSYVDLSDPTYLDFS